MASEILDYANKLLQDWRAEQKFSQVCEVLRAFFNGYHNVESPPVRTSPNKFGLAWLTTLVLRLVGLL